MKRVIYLIMVSFCLFGSNAMAQTAKQKVAVYVTGEAEYGYKKVIGSRMVTGITRSDNYIAVERTADFLAELNKEQDYQMSGAVSDNQIARLGQQFGVRYVVVADVSEVFESMFISARMIDVQTAQISKSTEASQDVNNMNDLTQLSEKIVLEIIGAPTFTADMIKLQGPYSTPQDLYYCKVPDGYHIASKEEIEGIIKNYQLTGKKVSFPIYSDIQGSYREKRQHYTLVYYEQKSRNNRVCHEEDRYHDYDDYSLVCTYITDANKSEILDLSFILDSSSSTPSTFVYGPDAYYLGYRNMQHIPDMVPGYVYVIKDKVDN